SAAVLLAGGAFVAARRFEGLLRWATLIVGSVFALELFWQTYLHPTLMEYQPGAEWGALARAEDPSAAYIAFPHCAASNAVSYYANKPSPEMGAEELAERVRRGAGVEGFLPVVEAGDRLAQRFGCLRREEQPGAIGDRLQRSAGAVGDHRAPAGLRFERGDAEVFFSGEDQGPRVAVELDALRV